MNQSLLNKQTNEKILLFWEAHRWTILADILGAAIWMAGLAGTLLLAMR